MKIKSFRLDRSFNDVLRGGVFCNASGIEITYLLIRITYTNSPYKVEGVSFFLKLPFSAHT